MFRSLLAALLVGLSSGFLYTNDKCHEGPSYWCSSVEVAETCQATNFCKQNIWGSESQVQSNNGNVENFITCKACTTAFKFLEKYVFSEGNEEKVIDGVSKLCDHVPETMTEQCKSFIKTYGKQALDMIAQKLDPSFVCMEIGMCDQASYESVLLGRPSEDTCNTCQSMVAEVATELKGLMTWWSSHCDEAADVEMCKETSQYVSVIAEVLFSEEICQEMQMC